jgi:peptide chain release factor 2
MNSFAGTRIWRAAPATCGAIFDAARPSEELKKIEDRVGDPDFWKDQAAAQKMLQRRRRLEEDRDLAESLRVRLDDLAVLKEWAEAGEPVADDLGRALDDLAAQVEAGETKKMLGGEHDRKNAIITIHPGAGGTESQDWAEMLLRMYVRWFERRNFKREMMRSKQHRARDIYPVLSPELEKVFEEWKKTHPKEGVLPAYPQ